MTRCTEKLINGSWENVVREELTDRGTDMILMKLRLKLNKKWDMVQQKMGYGQINDEIWDFEVRRANKNVYLQTRKDFITTLKIHLLNTYRRALANNYFQGRFSMALEK